MSSFESPHQEPIDPHQALRRQMENPKYNAEIVIEGPDTTSTERSSTTAGNLAENNVVGEFPEHWDPGATRHSQVAIDYIQGLVQDGRSEDYGRITRNENGPGAIKNLGGAVLTFAGTLLGKGVSKANEKIHRNLQSTRIGRMALRAMSSLKPTSS